MMIQSYNVFIYYMNAIGLCGLGSINSVKQRIVHKSNHTHCRLCINNKENVYVVQGHRLHNAVLPSIYQDALCMNDQ